MRLPFSIEKKCLQTIDGLYAIWPQPSPTREQIHNCKIISHRGEHDNKSVLENTFAAFDNAVDSGVWGIECDVRWTRDLHPVVFHDSDCHRIFGTDDHINSLSFNELRTRYPLIPSFQEFIARYGQRVHLMIEIKAEPYPDPDYQISCLRSQLTGLTSERDYHFLSLDPTMFQFTRFAPPAALITVARLNVDAISQATLQNGYGGITGHYLFLTHGLIERHRALRHKLGTGFIASRNCLFRELNRDIEWIFSNHSRQLLNIIQTELK